MRTARPNTQLPAGSLTRDLILCCGEDLTELKRAIRDVFGRIRHVHSYRCYAFFNQRDLTFAWTGIGTGCIEPLLCEILNEPRLERAILVGTAGAVSNSASLGNATAIGEASIACAGIAPKKNNLRPNWPLPPNVRTQRIVSTDYYYGFTMKKAWPTPELWAGDRRLARDVKKALAKADLVDMETGQFYHLLRMLRPDLQFLAIKGAANPLSDFSQQILHSESVLHHSLRLARELL